MFVIWLRMHPIYYFLANWICISGPVVGTKITNILHLFFDKLKYFSVVLTTVAEWCAMRGTWDTPPSAIDAID